MLGYTLYQSICWVSDIEEQYLAISSEIDKTALDLKPPFESQQHLKPQIQGRWSVKPPAP